MMDVKRYDFLRRLLTSDEAASERAALPVEKWAELAAEFVEMRATGGGRYFRIPGRDRDESTGPPVGKYFHIHEAPVGPWEDEPAKKPAGKRNTYFVIPDEGDEHEQETE